MSIKSNVKQWLKKRPPEPKQLGTSSGGTRCFQGKFYRLEERGKTLTIFRRDDSSILYAASSCREEGGIIEIEKFNLSQQV